MNRLAIVVLNWNGAELLGSSVKSLAQQSYPDFQIVVVDNDSSDNSKEILKELEKELKEKIHIIYNHKNSGFAGGVNIGIKYATKNGFDGVALFNNDAVADKDWLKNLARALENNPKAGIVTGLLLHGDGKTIDSTGDWYSKWGLPFPRDRDEKASDMPDSGYVFGASGGASLYRIEIFDKIGFYDEHFFAYYEDIDISFRAQLAGWKVYYAQSAIAYHERGSTTSLVHGFAVYQTFKNLPLLFVKNVPATFWGIIGPRFFLAYWLMFFNTARKGTLWYAAKGWLASIFYAPYALRQRVAIQRGKKVNDAYLNSILWQDLPPEQTGLRKFRKKFKK